jgi:hypothetical protein
MDYWKRRGAGMPAATQAVYDGEEVTCKQVIIPQRFGAAAGSEAYDEPLTTLQAVNIANLFMCSIYPA